MAFQLLYECELPLAIPDPELPLWVEQLVEAIQVHGDMEPDRVDVVEQEETVFFSAVGGLEELTRVWLWSRRCAQAVQDAAFERVLVSAVMLLTEQRPFRFDGLGYDEGEVYPAIGITGAVRALHLMAASSPTVARTCAAPITAAILRALSKFPVFEPTRGHPWGDDEVRDGTDLLAIGLKTLSVLALHDAAAVLRAAAPIVSAATGALKLSRSHLFEPAIWLLTFLQLDAGDQPLRERYPDVTWPSEICFLRAFRTS